MSNHKKIGRPKKQPDEIKNVRPIRVSQRSIDLLEKNGHSIQTFFDSKLLELAFKNENDAKGKKL